MTDRFKTVYRGNSFNTLDTWRYYWVNNLTPRKSQNVIHDNVYTKHIDTSFNTLDTKVNNLTGNVYTKSHIDTSFNTLDTT